MDEQLKVHLPVYDGPLDLLLDLIRNQQIDITDIPIARITEQYLEYLRMMEEMDINLAGEFLLMAATLILIKSRMLLPPDPLLAEGEVADPRAELVQRLLEHEKFKNAAQMLHQKQIVESSTWTAPGIRAFEPRPEEPEFQVTLLDLVSTFRKILERAKLQTLYEVERDELNIAQVIEKIRWLFERSNGTVGVDEIFLAFHNKRNLIAAFLAILEMAYFKAIVLFQRKTFGEIIARRQENFHQVLSQMEQWMSSEKTVAVHGPLAVGKTTA